jgi:hypothetical protein
MHCVLSSPQRVLAAAIFLSCAASPAQPAPAPTDLAFTVSSAAPASSVPGSSGSSLSRVEATDSDTGIHYVRLSITSVSSGNTGDLAPHFTLECRDVKGKHDLLWFLSFGGLPIQHFEPPFRPSQGNPFPPNYLEVKLKMDFEGYMRTKPYTRTWEAIPTGELRFCNASMSCPNMETARNYMSYLNALPTLRISYAKSSDGRTPEQVFQLRSLVDEANKTPICTP